MNQEISQAAAALGKKGGSVRSDKKAAAVRENGRKGGRPPFLELVVTDPAATVTEDYFVLSGQVVWPEIMALTDFGAEVIWGGWAYSAGPEAMEGYPAPGSYYLKRRRRA